MAFRSFLLHNECTQLIDYWTDIWTNSLRHRMTKTCQNNQHSLLKMVLSSSCIQKCKRLCPNSLFHISEEPLSFRHFWCPIVLCPFHCIVRRLILKNCYQFECQADEDVSCYIWKGLNKPEKENNTSIGWQCLFISHWPHFLQLIFFYLFRIKINQQKLWGNEDHASW